METSGMFYCMSMYFVMSLVSNKHVFPFFPGLDAWQRIMLTQSQELLKSPAGPAGEAEYREAQVQRRNLLPGNILFQLSHLVRERIYLLPSLGLMVLTS